MQTELTEDAKQYFYSKDTRIFNTRYIDNNSSVRKATNKYPVQDRLDRNTTYVSDILERINQLRLEINNARSKEDFEHISKLAKSISKCEI